MSGPGSCVPLPLDRGRQCSLVLAALARSLHTTRNSPSFPSTMTPSIGGDKGNKDERAGDSPLRDGTALAETENAAGLVSVFSLLQSLLGVLLVHQPCLLHWSSSVSLALWVTAHLLRLCSPLHCFPFDI